MANVLCFLPPQGILSSYDCVLCGYSDAYFLAVDGILGETWRKMKREATLKERYCVREKASNSYHEVSQELSLTRTTGVI